MSRTERGGHGACQRGPGACQRADGGAWSGKVGQWDGAAGVVRCVCGVHGDRRMVGQRGMLRGLNAGR